MAKRLRRFLRKEEIAGSKRVATSAAFENPARGSIHFYRSIIANELIALGP